jgi:hypothetical protein
MVAGSDRYEIGVITPLPFFQVYQSRL